MKNDLTIHQELNEEKTKKIIFVTKDYELCDIAEIDDVILNRVAAYQLIKGDLNIVNAQAKFAIKCRKNLDKKSKKINGFDFEDELQITCASLYTSCIITYAKCFTKTKVRKIKLDESDIKKNSSEELLEAHKRLMKLRHEWVAHSGDNDRENSKALIAYYTNATGGTSFRPVFLGTSEPMPEISDFEKIETLSIKLLEIVTEKINNIEVSFYGENNIIDIAKKLKRTKYIEIDAAK